MGITDGNHPLGYHQNCRILSYPEPQMETKAAFKLRDLIDTRTLQRWDGMARCTDTAHRGALNPYGQTVAIWGTVLR